MIMYVYICIYVYMYGMKRPAHTSVYSAIILFGCTHTCLTNNLCFHFSRFGDREELFLSGDVIAYYTTTLISRSVVSLCMYVCVYALAVCFECGQDSNIIKVVVFQKCYW